MRGRDEGIFRPARLLCFTQAYVFPMGPMGLLRFAS